MQVVQLSNRLEKLEDQILQSSLSKLELNNRLQNVEDQNRRISLRELARVLEGKVCRAVCSSSADFKKLYTFAKWKQGNREKELDKLVSPDGRDLIIYCKQTANAVILDTANRLLIETELFGPPADDDEAAAQTEILKLMDQYLRGPDGKIKTD